MEADGSPGVGPPGGRRWWPAVAAVATVLLLVAAIVVWRSGGDDSAEERPPGEDLGCAGGDGEPMADMECEAIGDLSDDVVLLTDADLDFSSLDREGRSVIAWADGSPPAPGEIIVTQVGPDGLPFYGRVVRVDGPTVETEHASLMEVFTNLHMDVDVAEMANAQLAAGAAEEFGPPPDPPPPEDSVELEEVEGIEPGPAAPEDHEQEGVVPGTRDPGPAGGAGDRPEGSDPGEASAGGARTDVAVLGVQLPAPAAAPSVNLTCTSTAAARADIGVYPSLGQARLHSQWRGLEMTSFEYRFSPSIRIDPSVTISAEGGCEASAPLFERPLAPVTFFIGPVPVVVTQKIGVDLEAAINAVGEVEISSGVEARADLGVRLQNGALRPFARAGMEVLDDSRDVDVRMTASIGTPLFYEAALYGSFSARPSVGPVIELAADPRPEPGQPALRVDGKLDAQFTLAAGVKIDLLFGRVGWEQRARFGPQTLLERNLVSRQRTTPLPTTTTAATTTTTTTVPDDGGGPGGGSSNPAAEAALAQARQAWADQPSGAPYVYSYRIDGVVHCVEGRVGEPSAAVPFVQGQGCGATEVPDPVGPLGVSGWHDFVARAIAEGRYVNAFYEGATGRPTYVETTDGVAATMAWLVRPGE